MERGIITMRSRSAQETPTYAAEALASAQISGRQLTASGGLFVLPLVVMSLLEAPIQLSEADFSVPGALRECKP
jgi:hypothetical protein